MRKVLIMAVALMLLLCSGSFAQIKMMGVAGTGADLQNGVGPMMTHWVGADINIFSDDKTSFTTYGRATYYMTNVPGEAENEGYRFFVIGQTSISWLTLAMGTGFNNQVQAGDNQQLTALKWEAGLSLSANASLKLGYDVLFRSEKPNISYPYLALKISP